MDQKRVELYDYIKGILMIGVVFGHYLNAFSVVLQQRSVLHLLVRTFDMPMYMLLGGYLLSATIDKYNLSQLLVRKVSRVARPTFILGGFLGIITYIVLKQLTLINVLRYIFGIWFMWSFFICTIIVSLVNKLIKPPMFQIMILGFIQLILHLLPINPFNLNYMFPFFVIGFYLFGYKRAGHLGDIGEKRKVCFVGISFSLFIIMFSFWNQSYTIWASDGLILHDTVKTILIACYRFCIGALGCVCAYCVIKTLYSVIDKRINDLVCIVGKESMSIYIIHSFIVSQCFSSALEIICKRSPILCRLITTNYRFVIMFVAPVASCITCLFICWFVVLIKKNKLISKIVYGIS